MYGHCEKNKGGKGEGKEKGDVYGMVRRGSMRRGGKGIEM